MNHLITNFLKQGYKDNISIEDSIDELVSLGTGGGKCMKPTITDLKKC